VFPLPDNGNVKWFGSDACVGHPSPDADVINYVQGGQK
jgi:hypothetical protein